MPITASNNNPITYETLRDASRAVQYPQYHAFKQQAIEIPTDIECIFRLQRYIDNETNATDAKSIAKLLLEDITNVSTM